MIIRNVALSRVCMSNVWNVLSSAKSLRFFLLWCLCISVSNELNAAHLYGSDIGYRFIDTGIYEVRITLYRDCNGTQLDTPVIVITDGTNTFSYEATPHGPPKDITQLNSNSCGFYSRCDAGPSPYPYGFSEHTYLDTIDLSAFTSCEWRINLTLCCRNSNITIGPANENHHNYAILNQCLINSAPVFEMPPTRLLCQGKDALIWQNVVDTLELKDSFSYHLVNLMKDSVSSGSYSGPFTPERPLTFFGFPNQNLTNPAGFHLNAATGLLRFRPLQLNQVAVITIEVREWRMVNGVMTVIGVTRRDMQVMVIDCPNQGNYLNPGIDSVSRIWEVCVKDSFCFDIQSNDGDGDSTFMEWNGGLPDGVFTHTSGLEQNAKGTFCWKPINVHVSEKPYSFSLFVWDNACNIRGEFKTTFFIYVRDSVDGVSVDAGPDIIDSAGMDSFYVSGLLDDYSGQDLLWTTSGDGFFAEPDSQSTWYYPGVADIKTCEYELYFEAIDSTPCLGDSKLKDTLLVRQQINTFNAGPDLLIYPYDTLILGAQADTGRAWFYRWSSSGDTWIENDTLLNTRFSAGDTDLYQCAFFLVLEALGCDTLSDTLWVQRDFVPMQAGADIQSVNRDSLVMNAQLSTLYLQQGYWRSTGSGTFSDSLDPAAVYYIHTQDWTNCSLEFIWEELPFSLCPLNADTVHASIHYTGMDAGPDQLLNLGDTAFLQAGPEVGPGPYGYWMSSGDGRFSDSLDHQGYYIPGPDDFERCGVSLYWNYPFPLCHQEKDSLKINFIYKSAVAGPDQQIGFGDTLFLQGTGQSGAGAGLYWTSSGDGTFSDTLAPDARYFPGPADWYQCGSSLVWHAAYPQCGEEDDTLQWTRIPFVVDAGPDMVLTGDSLQLGATLLDNGRTPGWWTSTGDGIFSDSLDPNALYYPGSAEQANCSGTLIWNAPPSLCTDRSDTMEWERQLVKVDAGPDQYLPIGSNVILNGTSSATSVRWETNGKGSFLDSSAKATVYFSDSMDQPLCSLQFHLKELAAACWLQTDSLQVFWMEEGVEIESLRYSDCFMDSIQIVLKGGNGMNFQWAGDGSGSFRYDSASGRWYYLPSVSDYDLDWLTLRMTATAYCNQYSDSIQLNIGRRDSIQQWSATHGPIVVYPNPSTDWLTISSLCQLEVESVELYDMQGKRMSHWVVAELPFSVSIEHLVPGDYVLVVHLHGGRTERMLVTKKRE